MMKGFSVDVKGRRQRLKYQERQRLQQQFVNDSKNSPGYWEPNEGKLGKFVIRLIK